MFISSDAGGGPLPGTRYDGTPSSAFPDPTGNPTNVLYNGVDYNMNHGVIKLVLTGARPSYYMYVYGSGGTIDITDVTHSKSYSSTDSLGAFATPGFVRVTLDATAETTTYTFGEHGNFQNCPAWQCGNSPMISAFQLVPRPPVVDNDSGPLLDAAGIHAALRGTLLSGDAKVWVFWGPTDGGTNKAAWTNGCDLGTNTVAPPVSYTNATGLLALNTLFYYRFYASNDAGTAWADSTTNFQSQGGTAILVR